MFPRHCRSFGGRRAGRQVVNAVEGMIRTQAHITHKVSVLGQDIPHLEAGAVTHTGLRRHHLRKLRSASWNAEEGAICT